MESRPQKQLSIAVPTAAEDIYEALSALLAKH